MRHFERDEQIETTMGNAMFEEYSNGGTSYRVKFIDGDNIGVTLSLGERAIISKGKDTHVIRQIESKYAPYEGNEKIFDAPVDFTKEGMTEFLQQSYLWVVSISCCEDSVEEVSKDLTEVGLENPTDYIHIRKGLKRGGPKYDTLLPDPEILEIDLKLGLFFDTFRKGVYQIGRKEFALELIRRGIVRVLEVGEKAQEIQEKN